MHDSSLSVCRLKNLVLACLCVCLSVHLSVSDYSVFCNFLFANFCTHSGDQLRSAFAFSGSLSLCFILFSCYSIYVVVHSWLNKLTDWQRLPHRNSLPPDITSAPTFTVIRNRLKSLPSFRSLSS